MSRSRVPLAYSVAVIRRDESSADVLVRWFIKTRLLYGVWGRTASARAKAAYNIAEWFTDGKLESHRASCERNAACGDAIASIGRPRGQVNQT
jgi:hypothetical protein